MDISKSIAEYVSRVLKNQPNRTMNINSIANHISNLKPKQKKYIKVSLFFINCAYYLVKAPSNMGLFLVALNRGDLNKKSVIFE